MHAYLLILGGLMNWAVGAGVNTQYLNCYKALTGVGAGNDFLMKEGGEETVLLPATRNGKKGLYLLTEQAAFFHPLPKAPHDAGEGEDKVSYYFRLQLPGQTDIYLTYSEPKTGVKEQLVSVSSSTLPEEEIKDRYVTLKGGEALDASTRKSVREEIVKRLDVTTVMKNPDLEAKPKAVERTSAAVNSQAGEKSYRAGLLLKTRGALETCAEIKDAEVAARVKGELERLKAYEIKPVGK